MDIKYYLEISYYIAVVLTLIWAVLSARRNEIINAKFKSLEVTSKFIERFDQLLKERVELPIDKSVQDNFWKRFWYLQQEQFNFWVNRLLLDDDYEMWMNERRAEWSDNKEFSGTKYQDAYKSILNYLTEDFQKFMNSVLDSENLNFKNLAAQYQKKHNLIKLLLKT